MYLCQPKYDQYYNSFSTNNLKHFFPEFPDMCPTNLSRLIIAWMFSLEIKCLVLGIAAALKVIEGIPYLIVNLKTCFGLLSCLKNKIAIWKTV